MDSNGYAAKLRHAADVIERTGADVLYQIASDHYCISLPSFLRIFAGQEVKRTTRISHKAELEATVDGIRFYTHEEAAKPSAVVSVVRMPASEPKVTTVYEAVNDGAYRRMMPHEQAEPGRANG